MFKNKHIKCDLHRLCVFMSVRYGEYLLTLGFSWTRGMLCHLLSLLDIYVTLRLVSDMETVSLATPKRVSLIQQCSVLFNLNLLWSNHNNNGLALYYSVICLYALGIFFIYTFTTKTVLSLIDLVNDSVVSV